MYLKNTYAFIAFKVIFVLICGYGLLLHMGPGKWSSFNYYTVLSNAVCFLYFSASLVYNIRRLRAGKGVLTLRPRWEASVVFCITITFLIYHFILRPASFVMNDAGFFTASNMIVHYIVPAMTLLDWLLFCPKGRLLRFDPLYWLLIPLFYFVFIIIRAPFAGNIAGTDSPYPYDFMDIQAHGWGTVIGNIGWIALGMLVLAYVIYFIDLGLLRVSVRKK